MFTTVCYLDEINISYILNKEEFFLLPPPFYEEFLDERKEKEIEYDDKDVM